MAVVETLEIRFRADLGGLNAQISKIMNRLGGIDAAAQRASARMNAMAAAAKNSFSRLNSVTDSGAQSQLNFSRGLKSTASELKKTGAAVRKATEGVGLHRMDEINLVGAGAGKSSGRARKSGAAENVDLAQLKRMAGKVGGVFEDLWDVLRQDFGGALSTLDKLSGSLGSTLLKGLSAAAQKLGSNIRERFAGAIASSGGDIASEAKSVISAAGEGMRSAALGSYLPAAAGAALVAKLTGGISGGKYAAAQAALEVSRAVKFADSAAESEARSAGSDLAKGFASGISNAISAVKGSISKLAGGAVSALKSLLKIASPSKLTQEVGLYFGQGFAGGIRASIEGVKNSASALAQGASGMLASETAQLAPAEYGGISGAVRSAVQEALGGTNLVVPLNVDGVKLGEASIRGINRVTRAAGRVLLEF